MTRALEGFGRLFMSRVRDQVIADWLRMIDGTMKGETAKAVAALLAPLSAKELGILRAVVPMIVDGCLHHFLWMIETEGALTLTWSTPKGPVVNIKEESDGLSGELYSKRGWVARFSSHK